jgi:hypothetical protein
LRGILNELNGRTGARLVMKIILLSLALMGNAIACEGEFISIEAGYNFPKVGDYAWEGNVPTTFTFGYKWPIQKGHHQWHLKGQHDSNFDKGQPVNDEPESSRNIIQGGYTFWFRKQR